MEYKKYIFEDSKENHWDYCCENYIPYIVIYKEGKEFCKLDFDTFPLTRNERFTIIVFGEHILPLYEFYGKYNNVPRKKYSYVGGGSCAVMTVFAKDAELLASQLFDFLMVLKKIDQERFNDNPFEIDDRGHNSEGYNVEEMKTTLKEMSNDTLISMYQVMEINGNFKYRPRERLLYESEISSRNINLTDFKN